MKRTGRWPSTSPRTRSPRPFRDHRFAPLSEEEFPRTRVEVSLLTPAEPFPVTDEADALARLRPGIDGLVLSYGRRRATFLPQVWESLPDARQFMAQLKLKAGLPADFWHADRPSRAMEYANGKRSEPPAESTGVRPPRPLVACDRGRTHPVRPLPA
ncbi:MAG: AmmeMemoRadiSam system protein A [Candidatus Accumulibacter necessarius]|uniref:AmmeMemoRadiSam system protein A n=1 Tax=Candidatus Accumulibacter necessarius TaxID=2954386 RepID=UPI002FC3DD4B